MGKALDVVLEMYAKWDSHDDAALRQAFEERCSPELKLSNPLGSFRGEEALGLWQGMQAAFPDARHEVATCVEQGEYVVTEGRLTGTHRGPLAAPDGSEIPATGRSIDVPFLNICRVQGDRVTEERVYFDNQTFMAQLGLVPAAAAA